jgi:hypothetical protein
MKKIIIPISIIAFFLIGFLIFKNLKDGVVSKGIAVGEDICAEFPKEFVESALGKPIIEIKKFDMKGTHVCNYFIEKTAFVSIKAENLNVERQKQGNVYLGKTLKTDTRIKMNHFITEEKGEINTIYLILSPDKFVALDRNSTKPTDNEGIIKLALFVETRLNKRENQKSGTSNSQSILENTNPESEPTKTTAGKIKVDPEEETTIQTFFQKINDQKASEAVLMMTPENTNNDSTKQAWGAQFNAFKTVSLKTIEQSMPESWIGETHSYKIALNVEMKPEAANNPIPFYGYEQGKNIRWIQITKINGVWKIASIATGP